MSVDEAGLTLEHEDQTSIERTPIQQTRYYKGRREHHDDQMRELFTMNCDMCSTGQFKDLREAKEHYRIAHQMRGYLKCCGKLFYYRSQVLDHIRQHNFNSHLKRIRELFTMTCDICTDEFKFEDLLGARRHYHTVHKTQGYLICCGKKFFRHQPLMHHVRLHNNPDRMERNAQIRDLFTMRCDICSDVEFEDFLGARKHYHEVHNTRGYLICCGKKFWRRKAMLEHVRTHINPKAFECDMCGKRFSSKFSLVNHFSTHTPLDSRAYKCSLCRSSFGKERILRVHVQATHNSKTGENFPCDKCNKK